MPQGDFVAKGAEPVEVFSYEIEAGIRTYVVLHSTTTRGSTTTYNYTAADIHVDD